MAYDEELAERVRRLLPKNGVKERKMFGGLAFMLNGNMCCGVEKGRLMVRVGKEAYAESLEEADAKPMDFTGKPLTGFVYAEIKNDKRLQYWVNKGVAFAKTLPKK